MQCAVLITLLTILTLVSSEDFRIGMLLTRTNWTATAMFSELRICFIKYGEEVEDAATVVYRHFQAAVGKTLPEVREAVPRGDYFSSMSHTLNACSASKYILSDNPDKARLKAMEEARKELILHMALSLMPDNYMAVKNLAYELEWIPTVDVSIPLSLLNDCRAVMDFVDPGLVLQSTFVVPTYIWDQYEGFRHHINVLSRAHHVMRGPRGALDADPSRTVRELQMNIQYLGVSPGILSIAFGAVVKHLFPNLDRHTVAIRPRESPDAENAAGDAYDLQYADHYDSERGAEREKWRFLTQAPARRTQVRVGIVSEHEDNSSPGNCLKRVFAKLAEFTHEDAENEGEREKDFEFVFFAREGSRTVFTATVYKLSERTYSLDHDQGSLEYNRAMLAAERLDVLLYIALPTEKLTWFLSHGRVAPVQVVFGVGHPLTSGSSNIDYSIVSSAMFQSLQTITQYPPSVEFCLEWGDKCAQELARGLRDQGEACGVARRSGCAATPFDSTPPSFYSEQLVVMDSLSYFLESHLLIYEEPVVPLQLSYNSSCATVNAKLRKWGFFPNITAEQLGCMLDAPPAPGAEGAAVSGGAGTETTYTAHSPPTRRTSRSVNLYTCIQIPKKMHPSFDPVIAGVLRADPQAVIMVEYKYAAFFPRLLERANADLLHQQQRQQEEEREEKEVASNNDGGGGGGGGTTTTSSSSRKLALFTMEELHRRILLIPRIPHLDYQQLISLSSVFLNTFPFGAGITSSEAIATCVPVVVDASRSSVLHLGLAQVRRLGDDFAADLVARGAVDDYIARAVLIANLDRYTLGGANGNNTTTTSGAAPPVHVLLDTNERREHGSLYAYRQALCRRRDRLLGDETAAEVAAEWAVFLKAVAMPYKE